MNSLNMDLIIFSDSLIWSEHFVAYSSKNNREKYGIRWAEGGKSGVIHWHCKLNELIKCLYPSNQSRDVQVEYRSACVEVMRFLSAYQYTDDN